MSEYIKRLQERIAPVREELLKHPLYRSINTLGDVQIFMRFHVFATWDFMSLLKALQRDLTCINLPWKPVGSANTRYLINEIVVGEESDIDEQGNRISHFELYQRAMVQAGSDSSELDAFIAALETYDVAGALSKAVSDASIRQFVNFTFDTIATGKLHNIAAVFTFGREDLIPEMFLQLVSDLDVKTGGQVSILKYYLERHIEVDGDHHTPLALEMLAEICGDDENKWAEAEIAVIAAIKSRIALWDGVLTELQQAVLN